MLSSAAVANALGLACLAVAASAQVPAEPPVSSPVTTHPPTTPPPIFFPPPPYCNPVVPGGNLRSRKLYTCSPPTPPRFCQTISNTDRVGFDLGNERASLSMCAGGCANDVNCLTWTWSDYEGGTCWYKSKAGRLIEKPGVVATECVYTDPPKVCVPYANIDFVGNDIGNKPGKSVGDCCDICNEFAGCNAYAWSDYQGGTCWLKEIVNLGAAGVLAQAKSGVTSSAIVPLTGGVCVTEVGIDYIGNDIGNLPSKTPSACCALCKGSSGCHAWSWSNWHGGTCWMKSSKDKIAPNAGVTSGTVAYKYQAP